ncbi:MAG: hypothetical protein R3C32_11785 [Chloroflexota bacterium]
MGIEMLCSLRTTSKMFCGCSTGVRDAPPNSLTCPVCLAMPAPRSSAAPRCATCSRYGIAIDATTPNARWDTPELSPDLPKGYQIGQYDLRWRYGSLTVDTSDGPFTVGITQAHTRGGHGAARARDAARRACGPAWSTSTGPGPR